MTAQTIPTRPDGTAWQPVCRAAFPYGTDSDAKCPGCGNAVHQHAAFDARDMIAAGFRVLPADVVDLAVEALSEAGSDNGSSFTCSEAESVADFMRAIDHPEDADAFLLSHSYGDDVGDSHVCATCEEVTTESGVCSEDPAHQFDPAD